MGRKSIKEARQLEIVKVFYRVAKKEGLENSSIAKIAKVMDVNPSLIIHYFKSKEELTLALIDFILEQYLVMFQLNKIQDLEPIDGLRMLIDNLFSRKWNRLFDDGLFYSCYALTFRDKSVREKYKIITNSLRETLARIIQRAVDLGLITVSSSLVSADLIFALIDGAYFYLSVAATKVDFEERLTAYKLEAYRLLQLT
ncbi:TetR family transcriptional regulator [Sphingobacterium sp. lm-10]|uniref:TetR family transcriptional regulator n=1 Tax=Sphingobacterium sp. lm-10 TaxID=2944904 RepID=UPI00201FD8CA|nr:TetR family transcriptional regulator [Sphingobacterium sp. lm-10]MCL7989233.1 TetR family transcriptional regulator [Sphingobacterium sp. lm-10]